MDFFSQLNKLLARPLIGLILLYQRTLSPDHGPLKSRYPYGYCKFHPTCSMYAKEVLEKQALVGIPRIVLRVLRCNPWTDPKIDPPYSLPRRQAGRFNIPHSNS
ncbi:MAG: membrane protein insertion efficiency factor YidD [Candidatus Doudnabacteria bacterium]|nr:membrane protein insertion efficiency factor YidD [Candidatus Doudnabacteria bacterium]